MENLRLPLKNGDEIVLLYVKHFNWLEKNQGELFNGEPTAGRIYRALKTKTPLAYYIDVQASQDAIPMMPKLGGIRITELSNSDYLWDYSFAELDDDNITDFDIDENDYKKLADWVKTEHEEFVARLMGSVDLVTSENDPLFSEQDEAQTTLPENIESSIMQKLNDMIGANVVDSQRRIAKNIAYMSFRDPSMLEALAMLTDYIYASLKDEEKGDFIRSASEVSMSKDLGKGANMYGTMLHLDSYLSENQGKMTDLTSAMYHTLNELTRRIIHAQQ